ncbi:MAG TPA: phosphoglycerate kinase, partial [Polyangia bacterium]|nr:phosphoglycerate kinase [Polyangia bacterium]
NAFLIGGAMANTFLKAKGGNVGKSRVEEDKLAVARTFLKRAEDRSVDVVLPEDVIAAEGLDSASGTTVRSNEVPPELMALDIGPKAAATFADRIGRARTVFWNGPMGVFEKKPFAAGTLAVAKAVAACRGLTVVGGGDSVAAVNEMGVAGDIKHISTGGGASLEFIEGKTLPGIAALEVAG